MMKDQAVTRENNLDIDWASLDEGTILRGKLAGTAGAAQYIRRIKLEAGINKDVFSLDGQQQLVAFVDDEGSWLCGYERPLECVGDSIEKDLANDRTALKMSRSILAGKQSRASQLMLWDMALIVARRNKAKEGLE